MLTMGTSFSSLKHQELATDSDHQNQIRTFKKGDVVEVDA